jgi:UDP-N-acetylglucosamine:LPS N-acetylglucosamine transferase
MQSFHDLSLPLLDILASSDAVLTKPGYGTFVEAACNDLPVLSMRRPDWPETPYLNRWLNAHGILVEVDQEQIRSGKIEQPLAEVFGRPRPPPVTPYGAEQAAQVLASLLTA